MIRSWRDPRDVGASLPLFRGGCGVKLPQPASDFLTVPLPNKVAKVHHNRQFPLGGPDQSKFSGGEPDDPATAGSHFSLVVQVRRAVVTDPLAVEVRDSGVVRPHTDPERGQFAAAAGFEHPVDVPRAIGERVPKQDSPETLSPGMELIRYHRALSAAPEGPAFAQVLTEIFG